MTFESRNPSRAERVSHEFAQGSPGADLSRYAQSHFHVKHHHHYSHHQPCGESGSNYESSGGAAPNEAGESGGKKFGGALEQLSQNRVGQILDKSASPEDKLSALREMSKAGKNEFEVRGANGECYKMRIEREQSGSREMVHLYMTGADGKERVAMRGIADACGRFTQEQDNSGKAVDFYGSAGAAFKNLSDGTSGGAPPAGDNVRPNPNPQRYQEDPSTLQRLLDKIPNPFRCNEQIPVPRADDRPSVIPQRDLDAQGWQIGRQALDRAAADARQQPHRLIGTDQGVYLRAGMAVDADGSPRARQIDPDAQTNTSMRYANNKSLNAEVVPYMVLPGGRYQQHGIKLGDMVLVRNTDNGRMSVAVFGDVGPSRKSGEGSMALAAELGLNPSPIRGGTSRPTIEYLVLPNTHGTKPQNQDELMSRIQEQRNRFGIA